jgi:hypothetical protein
MNGYNHYVPKVQITRALVLGTPATALCGDVFVPNGRRGGNGLTAEDEWPTCPLCEVLFDALPADAEEEVTA